MSLLPRRHPIEIEFKELSYIVPTFNGKEVKSILKNVSGKFSSGSLTAIMGPSGAGKTTLMNATAGYRISQVEGSILTNGKERQMKTFKKQCCYIMQDDFHLPHLTVKEAMHVATNLKLNNQVTQTKKREIIYEILDTLGLRECRDTRACHLSGGQRKRLSIAVELVNNPPIMFLDEPTSGLDSQNSFSCIKLLQSLAIEGRTLICTIHQPSARIFEMFDYLYALSSGECIYRGSVTNLLPHLSSLGLNCPSFHNPADYLIEAAIVGENTQLLADAVRSGKCDISINAKKKPEFCTIDGRDNNKNSVVTIDEEEKKSFLHNGKSLDVRLPIRNGKSDKNIFEEASFDTPPWSQFVILLKRNYVSILRDSMLTKLRIFSNLGVGLMTGVLYFGIGNEASKVHSNNGLLFCMILFNIFAGMLPTLLTFPIEMKVFLKEHHNSWYSLKAYYLAKTFADLPFQILYPIMFVTIVYFMTNQPMEMFRFCMFTVMCILTSVVAQSLALVIGAYFEVQEATFTAPIVTIPILLFSGFLITYSTIPFYLRWVTYLSYMKYSLDGSFAAVYGYQREKMDCSIPYCHFKFPEKLLEQLDIQDNKFLINTAALIGFSVFLRIFGYFVLRLKLRVER